MNIFKTKRKCAKFSLHVCIHSLENIPRDGMELYLVWQRGKKYKGELFCKTSHENKIEWDHDLSFEVTLFKDKNVDKFKTKYLYLYLCEGGKELTNNNKSVLSEYKINICDYLHDPITKIFEIPIFTQKGKLKVTIQPKRIKKSDEVTKIALKTPFMTDITIDEVPRGKKLHPKEEELPMDSRSGFLSVGKRRNINMSIDIHGTEQDKFLDAINNVEIKRRVSGPAQPRKGFVSKKTEYKEAKEKFNSQEKKLKILQLELAKKLQESNESTIIEELIIAQTPRYSNDSELPISAPIIFRSILEWKGFNMNSQFPKKVLESIERVVVSNKQDNRLLVFWMKNLNVLLNLCHSEFPEKEDDENEMEKISLFRIENGNVVEKSISIDEFESPVFLFKKGVKRMTQLIFAHLLRNTYDQLKDLLVNAFFEGKNLKNVILISQRTMKLFKENFIDSRIQVQFFEQLCYHLNAKFLHYLMNDKYATMMYSINLKMYIGQFESIFDFKPKKLIQSKQACDIFVIDKKSLLDESMRHDVCPDLNVNQIKKLLKNHKPDDFDPTKISPNLINSFPNSDESVDIDECIIFDLKIYLDMDISQWKKVESKDFVDKEGFEFLNK
eukprot:gene7533-11857_t